MKVPSSPVWVQTHCNNNNNQSSRWRATAVDQGWVRGPAPLRHATIREREINSDSVFINAALTGEKKPMTPTRVCFLSASSHYDVGSAT
mgnify:FL=1